MAHPEVHPYGAWPSPLSPAEIASSDVARSNPRSAGGGLYWLEARPENGGATTLVRSDDRGTTDVSLSGHNVRTRFHEYGGAEYGVAEAVVVYVDFGSQRVWLRTGDEEPRPLTPESGGAVRFSCFVIDPARAAVFCLREDQRDSSTEPVTSLVRLSLDGPNDDFGTVVIPGRVRPVDGPELPADVDSPPDFVLDHQLSPDGSRIAWVSWNHPNMPWDGTWLRVAELDSVGDVVGSPNGTVIAGGPEESVEQPMWLGPDTLLWLSDRTGWSNFYQGALAENGVIVRAVTEDEIEYGIPRWTAGMSSYALLSHDRVLTGRSVQGRRDLALVNVASGEVTPIDSGLEFIVGIDAIDSDRAALQQLMGFSPDAQVYSFDVKSRALNAVGDLPALDPGLVSQPEFVTWPVPGGATANGFLFRPANPHVVGPEGDLPPLIVTIHGGPTAPAPPVASKGDLFWTSRGFAVLSVNYGGSTGFGRAFRQRLDGQWGVVEVEDIIAGVRHLASAGVIDAERVITRGGSAGGYTTMALLAACDDFNAGCSYFGISDLAVLARETHKLESRYMHRLVAPWPEGEALYAERSPLHNIDRIRTPLLLLQGADDRAVPLSQAEMMADGLRANGLPVAMIVFEGEGHGFRRPETVITALEAEWSFYCQVLDLPHPGGIDPIVVENLHG